MQEDYWEVLYIIGLRLHTVSYKPLRVGSWFPTPPRVRNTKGIINPKNMDDDMCFAYSILIALNPTYNHPEKNGRLRPLLNTLNMEGIEYPVSIHDRDKFEEQNPSISVSIFGYDYFDGVYPLSI